MRGSRQWRDSGDKPVLHVYNWSDYIDPELVHKFEAANNCSVVIDTFDDNETMLAKMLAGATGYDVIFPSSYIIPVLRRNGLIQSLDIEKLPNVKANFDDKFTSALHEDSMKYSVPYAFSVTGIAYRKDKFEELNKETIAEPYGWDFLLKKWCENRISILQDIREMLGIGLKQYGFSNNSASEEELAKACDFALMLKNVSRRMDNAEYRVGLANTTFYAAIGYNCDVLQVQQENPETPIEFFVPSNGSNCCWDEMCITATSKHIDLAHKFIDFLYDGEIAAQNIDYVCTIQPNKAMWEFLDEEKKSNPLINIPQETLNRLELIKDVGDNIAIFNKWWDKFMSTKN